MKKILRFIGVLLLIVVLGVVILGLVAPKDITVERTVTINAPKSIVAEQMLQFKNFHNWSPWQELDPNMKSTITGEDGKTGAKYSWVGNKDVGKGEMLMKEAKEGEIDYELNFMEPWESHAEGTWKVADAGNGKSSATWNFTTHSKFPMNGIMMVMGMKKYLAKDFDKGLNKLKAYSEAHANDVPASDVAITEIQFPGHTYASIRKTLSMDDNTIKKFFSESYQQLGKNAGKRIAGAASCLAYNWDEKNKAADLGAAFPVTGNEPVNGATMVTVAPSKAYMTVLNGSYSGMEKAHEALGKYIAAKNIEPSMVIEEYVKGPGDEKDEAKWVTNIYYLVK